MLVRLIHAQPVAGKVEPAGAVVEVEAELGATLVAQGLARPERPEVETATRGPAERGIVRKRKGGTL